MVERLDDMPDGTVGFRIDGDVEREDYTEILVPALKAAVDSGRGLRALYLIEDLDDIEGDALWEDTKLGFDLAIKHQRLEAVRDRDRHRLDGAGIEAVPVALPRGGAPLPGGRSRAGESVGRRPGSYSLTDWPCRRIWTRVLGAMRATRSAKATAADRSDQAVAEGRWATRFPSARGQH